MVRMLLLTDPFTWEDLPTTDLDTGSLTMAAWIPRIQKAMYVVAGSAVFFHVVQSSVRFLASDARTFMYPTGYPFDTKKSPAYELINLAQVKISVIR